MSRNRSKKSVGLSFETLERRDVPAGFTGGLSNGVLTINGTTAADNITLTQTADVVRLDGYTNTWSASAIKQIRINAGAGDDTVRLAVSKQLAATLVGDGGAGRDALYATAQPGSWTGFEVGTLIAPPAGTEPSSTPAIRVVNQAAPNVMPGQSVAYNRWTYVWGLRDDPGYTMGPSQAYSTEAEARAAAQRQIDSTRGNGYWAVTHVRITGTASIQGERTASQTLFNPQDAINWIANNWSYGNWGGMNKAPAERIGISFTGVQYNQLEQLATILIGYGRVPAPTDAVDRAFMMHDLRLKWARDNVDANLTCFSKSPVVSQINRQLVNDLAPYSFAITPNSGTARDRAAAQASAAFKLLLS